MSLDWSLTDIKDYKELCWFPDEEARANGEADAVKLNPVTHSLIWATIGAGIGRLTEENIDEFAYRVFFWEKVFGGGMQQGGKEIFTTYDEVKAHVGLRTNVSFETRRQWEKRMKDVVMREFGWQAQRKIERAKEEEKVTA